MAPRGNDNLSVDGGAAKSAKSAMDNDSLIPDAGKIHLGKCTPFVLQATRIVLPYVLHRLSSLILFQRLILTFHMSYVFIHSRTCAAVGQRVYERLQTHCWNPLGVRNDQLQPKDCGCIASHVHFCHCPYLDLWCCLQSQH